MLRVFLAHAKEDEAAVVALYDRLKQSGYCPWLDKEDLLPGQNWRAEIPKAIKKSDVFIACLSQRSISKHGYVQREFKMALNAYADKPPGSIYFVPVRLDDCSIPDLRQEEYGVNLRDIHWVDLFRSDGYKRLMKALEYAKADSTGTYSLTLDTQTYDVQSAERFENSSQESTKRKQEPFSNSLNTQTTSAWQTILVGIPALTIIIGIIWLTNGSLQPASKVGSTETPKLSPDAQAEVALNQNDLDAAIAGIKALIDQNQFLDAILAIETANPRQQEDVIVAFFRGRAIWGLVKQGSTDYSAADALRAWEVALDNESNWMEITMAQGFAYYAVGREQSAIETWQQATALAARQPTTSSAYFSDKTAEEYVLNAHAGIAIAALSLSKIETDPVERSRLLQQASDSYLKTVNEAPSDFSAESLASNWLWLSSVISDWTETQEELSLLVSTK